MYRNKEYNKIRDQNKNLSNKKIKKLKKFFLKNNCYGYFANAYSIRYYNLFTKNVIFEPNTNSIEDFYYLGAYYNYITRKYDLAKKYYLQAIEKGSVEAIVNLGFYYRHTEGNYYLTKKYYLQAIEKGNPNAMNNLGVYYQYTEINYDLMKKYYLQAIEKGDIKAMNNLDYYYECNLPNNEDLQNYFDSSIRGNITIEFYYTFRKKNKDIGKNRIINLFCSNIDNVNLKIRNFKFCLFRIVNYINYRKLYKLWDFCEYCEYCELKNIKHFARYISKLRYHIKNKPEYKKYVNELFKNKTSQIFMEYLDLYHHEYLKKIFAPGGKGYIKTKNHFELIAKQ